MAMTWKVGCTSGIVQKPGMSNPANESVTVLGGLSQVSANMALPVSEVGPSCLQVGIDGPKEVKGMKF